jgi:hypothetical protein
MQGKSEQGMPSLSLLPENEEMFTASFGFNLYQNHMSTLSTFPLTRPSTSDKHDNDLSRPDFNISKMRDYL